MMWLATGERRSGAAPRSIKPSRFDARLQFVATPGAGTPTTAQTVTTSMWSRSLFEQLISELEPYGQRREAGGLAQVVVPNLARSHTQPMASSDDEHPAQDVNARIRARTKKRGSWQKLRSETGILPRSARGSERPLGPAGEAHAGAGAGLGAIDGLVGERLHR